MAFRITGNAPEEKLREVVERAQKRSAVYDMVTNGVPVAVRDDDRLRLACNPVAGARSGHGCMTSGQEIPPCRLN